MKCPKFKIEIETEGDFFVVYKRVVETAFKKELMRYDFTYPRLTHSDAEEAYLIASSYALGYEDAQKSE